MGKLVAAIDEALDTGVAIIFIQKNHGQDIALRYSE